MTTNSGPSAEALRSTEDTDTDVAFGDAAGTSVQLLAVPADAAQLGPWNAQIVFGGGVPVGGWAQLTLYSNGAYHFTGHFHDSGAISYNVGIVWVVVASDGTAYVFEAEGTVHGTFDSGSRDYNWTKDGHNAALAAGWDSLARGWRYRWEARANWTIGDILRDVIDGLEGVGAIVGVVLV